MIELEFLSERQRLKHIDDSQHSMHTLGPIAMSLSTDRSEKAAIVRIHEFSMPSVAGQSRRYGSPQPQDSNGKVHTF